MPVFYYIIITRAHAANVLCPNLPRSSRMKVSRQNKARRMIAGVIWPMRISLPANEGNLAGPWNNYWAIRRAVARITRKTPPLHRPNTNELHGCTFYDFIQVRDRKQIVLFSTWSTKLEQRHALGIIYSRAEKVLKNLIVAWCALANKPVIIITLTWGKFQSLGFRPRLEYHVKC